MNRNDDSGKTKLYRMLRNYPDKVGDRMGIETLSHRWIHGLKKETKVRKSLVCKEVQAIYHGHKANDKAEGMVRGS